MSVRSDEIRSSLSSHAAWRGVNRESNNQRLL
jgi:hypothetical protein